MVKNNKTYNQSVAIVLPISTDDKNRIDGKKSVALYFNEECYAILRNIEVYYHRKEERVARQFGTTHKDHPYIKVVFKFINK